MTEMEIIILVVLIISLLIFLFWVLKMIIVKILMGWI